MTKIFVNINVVLFILVITTTIDASRIFYLPLPKIHSLHRQPKIIQETTKKPTSDEFIPLSVLEQEEIQRRGDKFDWEILVDKDLATKRRILVNEVSPQILKQFYEPYSLNDNQMNNENDIEVSMNKNSEVNQQYKPEEQWPVDRDHARFERLQSNAALNAVDRKRRHNDTLFVMIVGTCCLVGVVGLVATATFWYKIRKRAETATDTEYPSYGVTGPNSSESKISPGSTMSDRKLAQSAQMFHYQQQRQQMMAQEKAHLDAKPIHSDESDDEIAEGGDYTVYECPGLAPTGEMEVRNPLFAEPDSSFMSPTSDSPSITSEHSPQLPSSSLNEKSMP